MAKKLAYGGVIFDDAGRVLLCKPTGEFDGYKWTFPKGKALPQETPEETALREVLEESGIKAKILGEVPGSFEGGTTENFYHLMKPIADSADHDWEMQETCWATFEDAQELISQTTNVLGRKRDLAVLEAAVAKYKSLDPIEDLLGLTSVPIRPLARAMHQILVELHKGCTPKICAPNSTPYVRYAPYPDLFHLHVSKRSCSLLISGKLHLKESLIDAGAQVSSRSKWDVLKVAAEGAVEAFSAAIQKNLKAVQSMLDNEGYSSHPQSDLFLPTLTLNLDKLSDFGMAWHTSDTSIMGQVYSYRIEELEKAVIAAGENLDRFLTLQIAKGMHARPLKKKILFWLWGVSGMLFIAVTRSGSQAGCGWLKNLPGYYDGGKDHIKVTASPFVLWDGKTLYRVYGEPKSIGFDDFDDPENDDSNDDTYVVDFGATSKLYSIKTDPENYLDIQKNKKQYWDYSVVPRKSRESLALGEGTKMVIHHAFYELGGELAEEFCNPLWAHVKGLGGS